MYLGAVASAAAYLLWNRTLAHLDATQVVNFINLIPVVGVVTAALLLGETSVAWQILGGFLVLIGVWISS